MKHFDKRKPQERTPVVKRPDNLHLEGQMQGRQIPQVGIFFCTQFPSLGIFINKKSWKSKKLRPPSIQLLKLI